VHQVGFIYKNIKEYAFVMSVRNIWVPE